MQLSDEEKQKQEAIAAAVENDQPVTDLCHTEELSSERLETVVRTGIIDPYHKPEKTVQEEPGSNKKKEGIETRCMGSCIPESPVIRIFRKLFGKKEDK